MPYKIGFMGTPDFAATALKALLTSDHEISVVYSQPPRPAGRGHALQKSAVHLLAEEHNIPVFTPLNFKSTDDVQLFKDHNLDIAVVAAYGLILPKEILDTPKLGCVNIHASLLPRWRGAAPIHRAIEVGDTESGITIMQMDEGLDTGDMLMGKSAPITAKTTGAALHDQLAAMGGEMIVQAMNTFETLSPTRQPGDGVTYAKKLSKQESALDWSESAEMLERKIRAFHPWPGTHFSYNGEKIKVHRACIIDQNGQAGTTLSDDLVVACGDKALKLETLQRPGKDAMDADALLRGYPIPAGVSLTDA